MKIAIIGSGISGLSSAYHLSKLTKKLGVDAEIDVIEKNNVPGGTISTIKENGFTMEQGADSFITSKPWALEMCKEIGLEAKLVPISTNDRRCFVYFDGKLKALPDGFFLTAPSDLNSFRKSDFFAAEEKERILYEQQVTVKKTGEEESVDEFVKRRFGNALLEKAAKPLIGGIYTGDTKKLSASCVLPEFVSMEKKFGSVIRGLQEKYSLLKTESGARYGLFLSLQGGMSTLINGLVKATKGVNFNYNQEVVSIHRKDGKWNLTDNKEKERLFDALILTVPSHTASELTKNIDARLSDTLKKISSASSIVANIAVSKKDLANFPEGVGIVVPPSEKMNILACSFTSRKFLATSKKGYELIRCFAGGVLNPDLPYKNETEITDLLIGELKLILRTDIKPSFIKTKKYFNAMPQYNLGHSNLIKTINHRTEDLGTVAVAGNAYDGIGIPDCIKSGQKAAEIILTSVTRINDQNTSA